MEEFRNEGDKRAKKIIGDFDRQIVVLKEKKDRNDVIFKEKDNEIKIADLKIKELKRQLQLLQTKDKTNAKPEDASLNEKKKKGAE